MGERKERRDRTIEWLEFDLGVYWEHALPEGTDRAAAAHFLEGMKNGRDNECR